MTEKHTHWFVARVWGEDRAETLFNGAPRASGDLIALARDAGEDRLTAFLRVKRASLAEMLRTRATFRAAYAAT
ncbi:hypothetical protein XINFAN_03654 [Pseudogemmobacter humi]|uniref:Uncharacterized protein n=1 Tax=Pseudogemmobacter humi TaxID=2483812 RepID=A0A3P5XS10_9RHOB|nr:hypothetical protein XINFAN_03654 [Pseudogemmobacter humi]